MPEVRVFRRAGRGKSAPPVRRGESGSRIRVALSPTLPGQPPYPAVGQTVQLWLNPYAFTAPKSGVWGNAGRNLLRAPGIWQIDTSLEKRIPLRERFAVSFRGDIFNLTNRAQIGSPNAKWTDPAKGTTFGTITSPYTSTPVGTGTPREMQFMLRLEF